MEKEQKLERAILLTECQWEREWNGNASEEHKP